MSNVEDAALNFLIGATDKGFKKIAAGVEQQIDKISEAAKKAAASADEDGNIPDKIMGKKSGQSTSGRLQEILSFGTIFKGSMVAVAAGVSVAGTAVATALKDWANFSKEMNDFHKSVGLSVEELGDFRTEVVQAAADYSISLKKAGDVARQVSIGMDGFGDDFSKTVGHLGKIKSSANVTADSIGKLFRLLTQESFFSRSEKDATRYIDTLTLLGAEANVSRDQLVSLFTQSAESLRNWDPEKQTRGLEQLLSLSTAVMKVTKGEGGSQLTSFLSNLENFEGTWLGQKAVSGDIFGIIQELQSLESSLEEKVFRQTKLAPLGISADQYEVLSTALEYLGEYDQTVQKLRGLDDSARLDLIKAQMTTEERMQALMDKLDGSFSKLFETLYQRVVGSETADVALSGLSASLELVSAKISGETPNPKDILAANRLLEAAEGGVKRGGKSLTKWLGRSALESPLPGLKMSDDFSEWAIPDYGKKFQRRESSTESLLKEMKKQTEILERIDGKSSQPKVQPLPSSRPGGIRSGSSPLIPEGY